MPPEATAVKVTEAPEQMVKALLGVPVAPGAEIVMVVPKLVPGNVNTKKAKAHTARMRLLFFKTFVFILIGLAIRALASCTGIEVFR